MEDSTANLGFVFSFFSLATAFFFKLMDSISEQLKPVFGLSVGVGVGGLIASLTGLKTPDRALTVLSGIGIAPSLIGMGVSLHGISNY